MPDLRVVLLGPPGVGKGTQAKRICESCGLCSLSTGEMLRQAVAAGTPLGKIAGEYMSCGRLVPDDVIIGVVRERLCAETLDGGFLLDGFPRTVKQAEALDAMCESHERPITHVIAFEAEESVLLQRISGRAAIEGRTDDDIEVAKQRLRVYEEATAPLIDYYEKQGKLHRIPAGGTISEVFESVREVLES